MGNEGACAIKICNSPAYKRGWCNAHYIRYTRYGRFGLKQRLGVMNPYLARTTEPTNLDFAWAAGIYEGEGSCAAVGSQRHTEQVTVPQKDAWLLHRLRAFFGGSVRSKGGGGIPVWTIHGARARGFLMTIYGLLSPRRQAQARRALRVGEFA